MSKVKTRPPLRPPLCRQDETSIPVEAVGLANPRCRNASPESPQHLPRFVSKLATSARGIRRWQERTGSAEKSSPGQLDAESRTLYLHYINNREVDRCMFEFKNGETAWPLEFRNLWRKTPKSGKVRS